MAGSRSASSLVVHFSLDEQVDEVEQRKEKARAQLRKAAAGNGCNAIGFFCSSITYVGVYYCRERFEKTGKYSYAVQGLLEGSISDIVSIIFTAKAECFYGRTLRDAMSESLRGLPAYLPLDVGYQAVYDTIIALAAHDSFFDFEFVEYDTPMFNIGEVTLSAFTYMGVFSVFYFAMSRLMKVDITPASAFFVGLQYFLSYLSDAVFDVDLDPLDRGIMNLMISCSLLSVANFMLESIAPLRAFTEEWRQITVLENKRLARPRSECPPEQDDLSQSLLENAQHLEYSGLSRYSHFAKKSVPSQETSPEIAAPLRIVMQ